MTDDNRQDPAQDSPAAAQSGPQFIPFIDRTGTQVAVGDRLLLTAGAQIPFVLEVLDCSPVLDPKLPPNAQRITLAMTTEIVMIPGSHLPGFLVGLPRHVPTPEPARSPIIFPGGAH